jgi:DNA mismatch endonuclease (patch repair protein)
MDQLTPEARSDLMRKIRGRGTKPEKLVCSIARRIVGYFRPNAKSLPGRPDLAIFATQKAVFVHGCFWHQHPNCPRSNVPKSNKKYWIPKLRRNVERDKENRRNLRRQGWKLLVVWECESRSPLRIERKLKTFLSPKRKRRISR